MNFTLQNFSTSDIVEYSSYVLDAISGPLTIIVGLLLAMLIVNLVLGVFGKKIEIENESENESETGIFMSRDDLQVYTGIDEKGGKRWDNFG